MNGREGREPLIAARMNGSDHRPIAQRLAGEAYAAGNRRAPHHAALPDAPYELGAFNHSLSISNEVNDEIEHARLNTDHAGPIAPDHVAGLINLDVSEPVSHLRCPPTDRVPVIARISLGRQLIVELFAGGKNLG